jgi:hypothetical protein
MFEVAAGLTASAVLFVVALMLAYRKLCRIGHYERPVAAQEEAPRRAYVGPAT